MAAWQNRPDVLELLLLNGASVSDVMDELSVMFGV